MQAWSTGGPGTRKQWGGESASRTLSGGAGSMRWDGLATISKSSSVGRVRILVLRVRRYVP